ncbi:MAG: hypothetical protein J7647_26460 [Cyanobacteria bacterium SBLK]|nr:hypothetical protein [Cyanobacteria bacterium SBLK]
MEVLSCQEIDMNSFCYFPHPGYIIAMHDEMLLFTNNAGLKANQKTLDRFVGENLAILNFPEELEQRKRLLRMDGKLTNYEFKAMN